MEASERNRGGMREGLARGVSQVLTYGLEVRKTLHQMRPELRHVPWPQLFHGIDQSALTSAFVFGSYYTVYHALAPACPLPMAHCLATFSTSFLKIPIGNSMRILQSHPHNNPTVLHTGARLFRSQGFRGIYSGYGLSLIEDLIENAIRLHGYTMIQKKSVKMAPTWTPVHGLLTGMVTGGAAAALTTPIDTLRGHMAVRASSGAPLWTPIQAAHHVWAHRGVRGLFAGAHLRGASNALRIGLFFAILEIMAPRT